MEIIRDIWSYLSITVEPRFISSPNNEVLVITSDFLQPGQNYNKTYGIEPQFHEILVIANTIQNRKQKIHVYFDITNKCQHVTET